MVFLSVAAVEGEFSFGNLPHEQRVALLQFVEQRSEGAIGDEFEKEFHFVFGGSGCDGVWALDALAIYFDSQARVLPGNKIELTATADEVLRALRTVLEQLAAEEASSELR